MLHGCPSVTMRMGRGDLGQQGPQGSQLVWESCKGLISELGSGKGAPCPSSLFPSPLPRNLCGPGSATNWPPVPGKTRVGIAASMAQVTSSVEVSPAALGPFGITHISRKIAKHSKNK